MQKYVVIQKRAPLVGPLLLVCAIFQAFETLAKITKAQSV
jgi:hypothetical protein